MKIYELMMKTSLEHLFLVLFMGIGISGRFIMKGVWTMDYDYDCGDDWND